MKKIHLLLTIYLVVCGIFIYSVFINSNQPSISSIENRSLVRKTDLANNINFIDKQFQNTISNLATDQFPCKDLINNIHFFFNSFKCSFDEKFTSNNSLLIKNGDIYKIANSDYYVYGMLPYDEQKQTLFENRIWNFERIFEKYGNDYHMYIYKPTTAVEQNWFDNHYYSSNGDILWNKLVGRLGDKYSLKRQEYIDLNDYKEKHYKIDHHWNYKGAYQGYCDIINIIKSDFDNIDKPYDIKTIQEHNYPFYGVISENNGYTLGFDDFITYKLDYEENYSIYINGEQVDQIGNDIDVIDDNEKHYIYSYYYGNEEKEIKIVNNNIDNDISLLVISDSFSNCINTDLAAHFKNTYIVDTRYINDSLDIYNTTFSLDDFLKEHDIDCILWLQYYKSLYFESACYLPIDLNY